MINLELLSAVNMQLATISPIFPLMGTMCSPKAKLIIELDGSQHLEQGEYDEERTKYLQALGYKVIRFWNHDLMKDIDSAILAISHAMEETNVPNKE